MSGGEPQPFISKGFLAPGKVIIGLVNVGYKTHETVLTGLQVE